MRKYLLIFLVFMCAFESIGQNAHNPEIAKLKKDYINVSYLGDVSLNNKNIAINPGMELAYGWQIAGKSYHKGNSYSSKYKDRQLYLRPFFNFYVRQHFHTGIGLGADIQYRSTFPSALYWDVSLGGGYLHTFYNDPVYEQVNDSTFKELKFQGNSNLLLRSNLHVGYDCSKKEAGLPMTFFVGGGIFLRYPQSFGFVIRQQIDMGVNIILRKKPKKQDNEKL